MISYKCPVKVLGETYPINDLLDIKKLNSLANTIEFTNLCIIILFIELCIIVFLFVCILSLEIILYFSRKLCLEAGLLAVSVISQISVCFSISSSVGLGVNETSFSEGLPVLASSGDNFKIDFILVSVGLSFSLPSIESSLVGREGFTLCLP